MSNYLLSHYSKQTICLNHWIHENNTKARTAATIKGRPFDICNVYNPFHGSQCQKTRERRPSPFHPNESADWVVQCSIRFNLKCNLSKSQMHCPPLFLSTCAHSRVSVEIKDIPRKWNRKSVTCPNRCSSAVQLTSNMSPSLEENLHFFFFF